MGAFSTSLSNLAGGNRWRLARWQKLLPEIAAFEPELERLSDNELRKRSLSMRYRLLLCLLVFVLPGAVRAQEPEELLPATTQVYVRWDGVDSHRPAYEKTALGKMMKGRLDGFHMTATKTGDGKLALKADVGVLDPTGAVRGGTLHYVTVSPKGTKPNGVSAAKGKT